MSLSQERRISVPQAVLAGLLLLIFCILLVYQFTSRSVVDKERASARIILQTIYRIEQTCYEEYGTYLPVDRETNGAILKLNDVPGRFRYRVAVAGSTFVAVAEADLDGDGDVEVWQIDQRSPEPFLKRQD